MLTPVEWRYVLPLIAALLIVMGGIAMAVPAHLRPVVALIALIQVLCVLIVAILISRQRIRLMQRVTRVVQRLARGEQEAQLLPEKISDLQQQVDAFNEADRRAPLCEPYSCVGKYRRGRHHRRRRRTH